MRGSINKSSLRAAFLSDRFFALPNFLTSTYLFKRFALRADRASLVASVYPVVDGIPKLTKVSVSLPAVVDSAISSKGLILSKKDSTDAAISVSKPKSINSAPRETNCSGILNRPEPIPARPLRMAPYSSSSISRSFLSSSSEGLISLYDPKGMTSYLK